MKFLITGGEGFIGRTLKQTLLEEGHEVFTLDIEGKPDFKSSIQDLDSVRTAMKGMDGVFHLAATTSPPQFESDLLEGFNTNVLGTFNVLTAAADQSVTRAVLASSSAVYGNIAVPGREDMAIPGHENMYATTKLFDEYLGKYFSIRNELEVVSLRLFNTYGNGENSKGAYSSVISKFLESITMREKPVIFGNGTQRRDFIYVKDVAESAKIMMYKGKAGESYNVGTSVSTSFNAIAELFSEFFGETIEFSYKANPFKNYQLFTQADMTRTYAAINWKAKYNLRQGIIEMMQELNLM